MSETDQCKGTFIFYEMGGGGLVGFGGMQKMAFKGKPSQENKGKRGVM